MLISLQLEKNQRVAAGCYVKQLYMNTGQGKAHCGRKPEVELVLSLILPHPHSASNHTLVVHSETHTHTHTHTETAFIISQDYLLLITVGFFCFLCSTIKLSFSNWATMLFRMTK